MRPVRMSEELAAEERGVPLREVAPFFWEVVEREDRRNRANRHTGAAIDAFHRIDVDQFFTSELLFILLRVDAIYRARVDASRVFGSDAGFSNYVSHSATDHC